MAVGAALNEPHENCTDFVVRLLEVGIALRWQSQPNGHRPDVGELLTDAQDKIIFFHKGN